MPSAVPGEADFVTKARKLCPPLYEYLVEIQSQQRPVPTQESLAQEDNIGFDLTMRNKNIFDHHNAPYLKDFKEMEDARRRSGAFNADALYSEDVMPGVYGLKGALVMDDRVVAPVADIKEPVPQL